MSPRRRLCCQLHLLVSEQDSLPTDIFNSLPNLRPVDPVLPEVDGQGLQSPLEPREKVFLVAEVTDDIVLVQRLVGDVSTDVRDLLSFVVGLCGKSKEIQC